MPTRAAPGPRGHGGVGAGRLQIKAAMNAGHHRSYIQEFLFPHGPPADSIVVTLATIVRRRPSRRPPRRILATGSSTQFAISGGLSPTGGGVESWIIVGD
jgi:hypothetical protein